MTAGPLAIRMTVEEVGAAWLAGYSSANTRAAYGADLRAYLSWCAQRAQPPFAATAASVDDYRQARESAGAGKATVARQFAALRAFYTAAHRAGACADDPFATRSNAAPAESATAVMTSSEVARLRAAAAHDPRLEVLVQLLLGEGLRLSETLAIDHADVSGSTKSRRVRVMRHGRPATIELNVDTSAAVGRLQAATGSAGPLLVARPHQPGPPERLSRFGADFLIKQAAQAAGIEQVLSANVLRRTHAAMSHDAGDHIDDIRDRMGHRDVRTTRRYLAADTNQHTTTPGT